MTFALNGLVFVLIGLQLPYVRAGIRSYSMGQLLFYGVSLSALLIAVRVIWVFPGARLSYFIRRRILHQDYALPDPKQTFIVGWTGMRGVVALAAAMAIPERLADGSPFPQRNLIIFLTFCVILVTLVLQGLSLPWIIRKLGLAGMSGPNCEEREARRIVAQAALDRLEQDQAKDRPEFAGIYDDLRLHYEHTLMRVKGPKPDDDDPISGQYSRALLITLDLLRTERETALQLQNGPHRR